MNSDKSYAVALVIYGATLLAALACSLLVLGTAPQSHPREHCQREYVTLAGQPHGTWERVCQL